MYILIVAPKNDIYIYIHIYMYHCSAMLKLYHIIVLFRSHTPCAEPAAGWEGQGSLFETCCGAPKPQTAPGRARSGKNARLPRHLCMHMHGGRMEGPQPAMRRAPPRHRLRWARAGKLSAPPSSPATPRPARSLRRSGRGAARARAVRATCMHMHVGVCTCMCKHMHAHTHLHAHPSGHMHVYARTCMSIILLWGFLHHILHIGQQVGHMQNRCNTPTSLIIDNRWC